MKSSAAIIFPRTDDWLVGTLVAGVPTFVIAKDEDAITALLQSSNLSADAWLALPSRECLAARISSVDLPRRGREQAMGYRLEEHIPWAAEEITASFGPPGPDSTLLAVAARKQALEERVERLKAAGVEIVGAAPVMALAAANLRATAAEGEKPNAMVIGDATVLEGNWISLVHFDESGLAAWYLLPDDVANVLERLRSILPPENPRIIVCDLPLGLQSAIENSREFLVIDEEGTVNERACLEVQRLIDRRAIPLVDLYLKRRAGRVLQLSGAIMIAILAAACVGLLYRIHRYDLVRAQYEISSQATFSRLFPKSPVPAGVVSRLVAEARELRGKVGDGHTAAAASLTPALAKVLAALNGVDPAVRFEVSDLRMDGDHLSITGQTAKLDDVDAVAQAVRSNGAWFVSPPHSEQQGSNISFTIDATPLAGGVAKADGSRLP